MKINKERAIYLSAVTQMLGVAQFGFFAGQALNDVLALNKLPGSLVVVVTCAAVYIVFTLAGYLLLADRFTKE